jgi:hypothetical protein
VHLIRLRQFQAVSVKLLSKYELLRHGGLNVSLKEKTIISARMAADGWKGLILGFLVA